MELIERIRKCNLVVATDGTATSTVVLHHGRRLSGVKGIHLDLKPDWSECDCDIKCWPYLLSFVDSYENDLDKHLIIAMGSNIDKGVHSPEVLVVWHQQILGLVRQVTFNGNYDTGISVDINLIGRDDHSLNTQSMRRVYPWMHVTIEGLPKPFIGA